MSTEDEELSDAVDVVFDLIDQANEALEGCPFAYLFAN
jgi:hypothetical protein